MTEDPEKVLPEQGLAPRSGDEEDRAKEAIEHQEDHADGERRKGQ